MEELKEALYELRQRKLLMITAIVALVLIIGSIILFQRCKNIRAAQVESLVARTHQIRESQCLRLQNSRQENPRNRSHVSHVC